MSFDAALALALVVVAAAVTGVTGLLVTRRVVCTAVLRGRAARVAPLRGSLVRAAAGDQLPPHLLASLRPRQWRAVEPEILRLAHVVRGEGRARLVELLRRHGRVAAAEREVGSAWAMRRARAAELLGLAGDSQSLPALARLLSDRDHEVRLVAARAIGRIGQPAAVGVLVAALERRDVPARVAAQALVHLQPGADRALTGAVGHRDPLVRAYLMEVLGLRRSLRSAAAITQVMKVDPDAEVRLRAAKALSRLAMPSSTFALVASVRHDPDIGVRAFAARALGEVGGPGAVPALLELLVSDPPYLAAHNAAQALARLGGPGLRALRTIAYSDDRTAAAHAEEALSLAAIDWVARNGLGAPPPGRRGLVRAGVPG